jgi:hypothetical protein
MVIVRLCDVRKKSILDLQPRTEEQGCVFNTKKIQKFVLPGLGDALGL